MCFGTGHTTDKKNNMKKSLREFSVFFRLLHIAKPLYPNHKLVISVMNVLFSVGRIANLSDYVLYERFTVAKM